MLVFFDIQHDGELHLDEEGMKFISLDDAHAYLLQTLREFTLIGGDPSSFTRTDTVVDITDRGQARRILVVAEVIADMSAPRRQVA
jgi:hypothetical protein